MQFVSLCVVIREGNASKDGHAGTLLQSLHSRPRQKEEFENSQGYLVRLRLKKQQTTAKLHLKTQISHFQKRPLSALCLLLGAPTIPPRAAQFQGSAYL